MNNTDQIVWRAGPISKVIGLSEKATYAKLESGKIPGAKKVNGNWALNVRVWFASFEDKAA